MARIPLRLSRRCLASTTHEIADAVGPRPVEWSLCQDASCALGMLHLGPRSPVSGELLRGSVEAKLDLFVKRPAANRSGRRKGLGQRPARMEGKVEPGASTIAEHFIIVGARKELKLLLDMPMIAPAVLASHGLDADALALLRGRRCDGLRASAGGASGLGDSIYFSRACGAGGVGPAGDIDDHSAGGECGSMTTLDVLVGAVRVGSL